MEDTYKRSFNGSGYPKFKDKGVYEIFNFMYVCRDGNTFIHLLKLKK